MVNMLVLVGSTNPVKVSAARTAFGKFFDKVEVVGKQAQSGVPDQPVGEETLVGAKNRAMFLRDSQKADFYVGVEGGMSKYYQQWFAYGAMCIVSQDGRIGYGISPWFPLPPVVYKRLLKGEELGKVIDSLTGQKNTKHKGGAISFFTNNVMNRKQLYVQGLIVALIPFIKKELF